MLLWVTFAIKLLKLWRLIICCHLQRFNSSYVWIGIRPKSLRSICVFFGNYLCDKMILQLFCRNQSISKDLNIFTWSLRGFCYFFLYYLFNDMHEFWYGITNFLRCGFYFDMHGFLQICYWPWFLHSFVHVLKYLELNLLCLIIC